jgi:hypothetical protein
MIWRHRPGFGSPLSTLLRPRTRRLSKVSGVVVAGGLIGLSLAGCASHATTSPPVRPAASRPPSRKPVASAVAAPAASPTPCPADSGWTGQDLSTAPPDPTAWLTAAQMPDAAIYHWTPQAAPVAMPWVGDMWNVLNAVSADDFLAWQLQGYQGSASSDSASQTIYLYASESQAYCGYQTAIAAAANNQVASRSFQVQRGITADAVTTETVSGEHDSAWAQSWTAPSGPANFPGPQTDVEYIAQVGTALTFVSFAVPGLNQSVPDAAAAQATLSEIIQDLSVYASGS